MQQNFPNWGVEKFSREFSDVIVTENQLPHSWNFVTPLSKFYCYIMV